MADRGQADVLLPTPDGSSTAFSSRFGECYHNRNGALSQARHVFLEGSGARRLPAPRILEIGFGLGLNFLTSAADALGRGAALDYLAYENDPQPSRLLAAVGEQLPGHELALWHALLAAWPADQPAGPQGRLTGQGQDEPGGLSLRKHRAGTRARGVRRCDLRAAP